MWLFTTSEEQMSLELALSLWICLLCC